LTNSNTAASEVKAASAVRIGACARGMAMSWKCEKEKAMPGVKQSRDGAVGILILNEPASLNAMTPDLLGGLATAIGELTADPTIRSLVLTGEGRGFCSGQNLKASEALGQDIVAGVMKFYWPAFKALRECRVPVVIAVNGVAAGGGFSLAMAGDMIVAARSASFIQVFSRIALVPDLGSTWLLPRLVGRQRALELMLFNEPLTAERAREWGLVREVVDDDKTDGDSRQPRATPGARPDARAGCHPHAAGGERACGLCRAVPPRDRDAVGDTNERGCIGGTRRVCREAQGTVQRTLDHLQSPHRQHDRIRAGLAVHRDRLVLRRLMESHRGFCVGKLHDDDLVARPFAFQQHRMLVGDKKLAVEILEYVEEARLVAVVDFALIEFQLGDDVDAHGILQNF